MRILLMVLSVLIIWIFNGCSVDNKEVTNQSAQMPIMYSISNGISSAYKLILDAEEVIIDNGKIKSSTMNAKMNYFENIDGRYNMSLSSEYNKDIFNAVIIVEPLDGLDFDTQHTIVTNYIYNIKADILDDIMVASSGIRLRNIKGNFNISIHAEEPIISGIENINIIGYSEKVNEIRIEYDEDKMIVFCNEIIDNIKLTSLDKEYEYKDVNNNFCIIVK